MAQTHYKQQINAFAQSLRQEERAQGTIENYLRHLRAFAAWLGGGELTPATAPAWKAELLAKGYAPGTVNAMLVPLNRFLDFLGYGNCKVKALRIQRRLFRENRKELTGRSTTGCFPPPGPRARSALALLMEAICATGIRVSEVQYLTVEALREGGRRFPSRGRYAPSSSLASCGKAAAIRQKRKSRFRRGVSHQKRKAPLPQADLGRDESPVLPSWGGGLESVPPQPAPPVCPGLLQRLPGCGQAGGRAGAQLFGNHAALPHLHRQRTRAGSWNGLGFVK